MYVTEEDYRVVIGDGAYKVVTETDENKRINAESEAMEEMAGYLRPKYDVNRIFASEGDARNRLVVMFVCDIALYHMSSSSPGRMGADTRKERYDRAVEWLKEVQTGKVVPDLPQSVDESTGQSGSPIYYGYDTKPKNIW